MNSILFVKSVETLPLVQRTFQGVRLELRVVVNDAWVLMPG